LTVPTIASIRPVLLSAPYAYPDYLEVQYCLPSGYRTCGLVEVTLDDGTTGLGEGYLAVFAPRVFNEIVSYIAPHLVGCDSSAIAERYRDMCRLTGYWSLQGAVRHVISALEIALVDAESKRQDMPAWSLLKTRPADSVRLYGSGGDSPDADGMREEMRRLGALGIDLFKIRARAHEIEKTVWVIEEAAKFGIRIAVDMCQNLVIPAHTSDEVIAFARAVSERTSQKIVFLEEPVGPADHEGFRKLRRELDAKICGGEIVTTGDELCERLASGLYDAVQPDATVAGGIMELGRVFEAACAAGAEAIVHCWGGGVCLMANYHAAFAFGGRLAEWPLPEYPLRQALLRAPLDVTNGTLQAPRTPGLGVALTPEIEKQYAFREDAVYLPPKVAPPATWTVPDSSATAS